MTDTKYWWQSRTIWVNIVATIFAILGTTKALPAGVDQDQAISAIMGVVTAVNLVLRLTTKTAITTGAAK